MRPSRGRPRASRRRSRGRRRPVSDAAEELCLAGNSVSTLVNQLVALGLLRREVDPADRRAALLHTTGEAVERLAAWRARRTLLVGEVVAGLSAEDRAALTAALPALHGVAGGLRGRPGESGRALTGTPVAEGRAER
ncbi:MarR family winged helix-turn-helix transcriptional regulator [Kitasatospora sp. NPDC058218]|uniref:MarR family winged helix-turn-helix transcriptional regulator n=1 Tax=Kitasatospora sp. NPDC058218 TaxID=3346385 RepID=UPI0036DA06F3